MLCRVKQTTMLIILIISTLVGYKNINKTNAMLIISHSGYKNIIKYAIFIILMHITTLNNTLLFGFIILMCTISQKREQFITVYPTLAILIWLLLDSSNSLVDSIVSIEVLSLVTTIITIVYSLKSNNSTKSFNNLTNLLTFNMLAYLILVLAVISTYNNPMTNQRADVMSFTEFAIPMYFLIKFTFVGISITKESAYAGIPITIIWLVTAVTVLIIPAMVSPLLHNIGVHNLVVLGLAAAHIFSL